jgi:hypothetical protein
MTFPNHSDSSIPFPSRPPRPMPDIALADHQLSPTLSTSPSFAETSPADTTCPLPHEPRDEAFVKIDSSSSKIKKKFSELDIRGAMADLDIRKSGKRTGIEEFYIQLDEPHKLFWCPGGTVTGNEPIDELIRRSSESRPRSACQNTVCDIETSWTALCVDGAG